jgi:large subunit ribosomal protein L24
MKIRKGDKVKVISGRDKGQTGIIIRVLPKARKVVVEGLNMVQRAYKPSQIRPKGGIKSEPRPLYWSKIALVDAKGNPKRAGFSLDKDGKKSRILRAGGKGIKASQ